MQYDETKTPNTKTLNTSACANPNTIGSFAKLCISPPSFTQDWALSQ